MTPTEAIRQVLADGHWHPREQLIRAAMAAVPPGKAARAAQRRRAEKAAARRRAGQPPAPAGAGAARHDDVAVGARILATDALMTLRRRGHIERHADLYHLTPPPPAT